MIESSLRENAWLSVRKIGSITSISNNYNCKKSEFLFFSNWTRSRSERIWLGLKQTFLWRYCSVFVLVLESCGTLFHLKGRAAVTPDLNTEIEWLNKPGIICKLFSKISQVRRRMYFNGSNSRYIITELFFLKRAISLIVLFTWFQQNKVTVHSRSNTTQLVQYVQ